MEKFDVGIKYSFIILYSYILYQLKYIEELL